jgi:hypothetical protein
MDCKKLALSTAAIGLALVGCDGGETLTFPARNQVCASGATPPCETTEPAAGEAMMEVEQPETFMMEPTSATYVVSVIDIPEASGGAAPGFNLDGLNSGEGSTASDATCEEFNPDFVNSVEADHVGVDNALQGLVGTIEGLLSASDCPGGTTDGCLGATLQEQIAEGSLILLMEVSGINDFQFDSEVELQLFLGAVPGDGMPMVGGDGQLAADQEFEVAQMLGDPVAGDIFQGRLRATTPTLTITVDTGDFMLPLMISNAEVRFDISESSLDNGQIGGFLRTEDIIAAASEIMPGIEETVRSVIESVADVQPSAADPAICDSVSVGLTFGATTATRL